MRIREPARTFGPGTTLILHDVGALTFADSGAGGLTKPPNSSHLLSFFLFA